jgi:uncharacterized protein (TIGR03000 family)
MSHPRFLNLAVPAVAVAALLFATGDSLAGGKGGGGGHGGGGGGHGGGGHAGGGHAGGAHMGGAHVSGGAVHVAGARVGVVHVGGVHHVVGHPGFHNGFGHSGGWGWGGGGVGFGFGFDLGSAPGYGSYASFVNDYYGPNYYYVPSSEDYGAQAAGGGAAYSGSAGPGGAAGQQDLTAHVAVKVPDGAEVWFGQGKTRQRGVIREFVSPTLTPGQDYTYEVKARWMDGDKEVVQTRQIDVSAGSWKTIDFTRAAPEILDAPKPKQ